MVTSIILETFPSSSSYQKSLKHDSERRKYAYFLCKLLQLKPPEPDRNTLEELKNKVKVLSRHTLSKKISKYLGAYQNVFPIKDLNERDFSIFRTQDQGKLYDLAERYLKSKRTPVSKGSFLREMIYLYKDPSNLPYRKKTFDHIRSIYTDMHTNSYKKWFLEALFKPFKHDPEFLYDCFCEQNWLHTEKECLFDFQDMLYVIPITSPLFMKMLSDAKDFPPLTYRAHLQVAAMRKDLPYEIIVHLLLEGYQQDLFPKLNGNKIVFPNPFLSRLMGNVVDSDVDKLVLLCENIQPLNRIPFFRVLLKWFSEKMNVCSLSFIARDLTKVVQTTYLDKEEKQFTASLLVKVKTLLKEKGFYLR